MLLLCSMHSRAMEDGFMDSAAPQMNNALSSLHQCIQCVQVTCLFRTAAHIVLELWQKFACGFSRCTLLTVQQTCMFVPELVAGSFHLFNLDSASDPFRADRLQYVSMQQDE